MQLYEEYFAWEGWTKCEGGLEDWDSYVDLTIKPGQLVLVHRLMRYWVKRNPNMQATMVLGYLSDGADETYATPTNDRQHATLLIVDDIVDLDQHLKLFELPCGNVANPTP